MGPLLDKDAVDNYQETIAQVIAQSGKTLYGGSTLKGDGHFVEPTIVEAKRQYVMVKHETFAPILYVMRYRTRKGVVYLQNDVHQGLSSAIFTK